MSKTLGYDSNKMVLKARSLNDYVFDIKKPICISSYITECVRHNLEADFIIMENPIYSKEIEEEKEKELIEENDIDDNNLNKINIKEKELDINVSQNYDQNLTCVHYPFDNLLTMAQYNPLNNNINSDIENNINLSLTKSVDNLDAIKKNKLPEDNLDLFINSLITDINKKIKSDYDYALNNIGNDSELNNQIKTPSLFSSISLNISTYSFASFSVI